MRRFTVLSAVLLISTLMPGLGAQGVTPYNSDDNELVTDALEMRALLSNTPQWVTQLLHWPTKGEIDSHLGIRSEQQVSAATDLLHLILKPEHIPPNIGDHWIPMRDWNIFYGDWVDHGGADAFLINWENNGTLMQIIDSPNFVVIGMRPQHGRVGRETAEEWAVAAARLFCIDIILPVDEHSPQHFRTLRIYEPNAIVEGDWVPIGAKVEGEDLPTIGNADIERVKFFTNGNIVALSVPKYLWDQSSLVNPFAERFPRPETDAEVAAISEMLFQPDNPPVPEPVAYDPSHMRALVEELLRTTPSEDLLADWSRRMLDGDPISTTAKSTFEGLTLEQRGLWHAQQLAERVMAEGVRSLDQGRFDEAATRFMHVLLLEPENVSAYMLLRVTRNRARTEALANSESALLPWFVAADQAMLRHETMVEERRVQMEQRSERELQIRDLRTQWVEAYQEGDLRRARQILLRVMEIDPGGTTPRFFLDLIDHQIQVRESELE